MCVDSFEFRSVGCTHVLSESTNCVGEVLQHPFLLLNPRLLVCLNSRIGCRMPVGCRNGRASIPRRISLLHTADVTHQLISINNCVKFVKLTMGKRQLINIDLRQFLTNKINMFHKQIEKINSLLHTASNTSPTTLDYIALITSHVSRPKTTHTTKPSTPKYTKRVLLLKQQLLQHEQLLLQALFQAKCKDLGIEHNQKTWECFLTAFQHKNPQNNNRHSLNFSDLSLGPNCTPFINQFLKNTPHLLHLNLSKNPIQLNNLIQLQHLKQLILNNCKLSNQPLQTLFQRLLTSPIERISLSSPELKHRNSLTRYDTLITLIQHSNTLHTLELSNIEIRPDNGIIERSRNTTLKVLDLSQNTNVTGICPSLHSLNLSHNNITLPFTLPLAPCELLHLDLSSNSIPYYHFKSFLKTTHFPKLQTLTLNHLHLNGQIKSIQQFLQAAVHLTHLSTIDCDFTPDSYTHILNGIKNNRSLKYVDLTRNKIHNERVAQHVSLMLQYTSAKSLKMRNCDIKDHLGKLLFNNIHRNKNLEKIDLTSNLLGDETARTICTELKQTKTLVQIVLQENIIKYKDMREINSYLQGNRYFNYHSLDKEYIRLNNLDKQNQQMTKNYENENDRVEQLQRETEQLETAYYEMTKKDLEHRKKHLQSQIIAIREVEAQIEQSITLAEMKETALLNSVSYHSQTDNRSSLNPELQSLQSH